MDTKNNVDFSLRSLHNFEAFIRDDNFDFHQMKLFLFNLLKINMNFEFLKVYRL